MFVFYSSVYILLVYLPCPPDVLLFPPIAADPLVYKKKDVLLLLLSYLFSDHIITAKYVTVIVFWRKDWNQVFRFHGPLQQFS